MRQELLSRDALRLMLKMRRAIRQEFGVDVALNDPGAAERLYRQALASRQRALQEMAVELAGHVTPRLPSPAAPEPTRYYRGAALPERSAPRGESSQPSPRCPSHKVYQKVYRGRVIAD